MTGLLDRVSVRTSKGRSVSAQTTYTITVVITCPRLGSIRQMRQADEEKVGAIAQSTYVHRHNCLNDVLILNHETGLSVFDSRARSDKVNRVVHCCSFVNQG
jgi:hypothetical protein